ncbi:MAG: pyridoxal-dependent decarboxylase [Methylohalobius sp.]|nr:pyridoxal-dependent decarboxylase [Methylohalobius sp.]
MLTRRQFLGVSAAGALASGCRPANFPRLLAEREASISRFSLAGKAKQAHWKNLLLGYPINMNAPPEEFFAWREELRRVGIGGFAYNNVGNPYKPSSIAFNTHDFERELIARFGQVYGFPPGDVWGFLSHSGTDSNMHGLYMGRTLLKGRTGILPRCYFTKEAHYSIQILRDLLGLETVWVETLPDASMDPEDLKRKLAENADWPALVVATVGTTFKGGIDPIDRIQEALRSAGIPSYLHLDAALFGGYLPHTPRAFEVLHSPNGKPKRYDSLAVSCHKFFGFHSPAGIFLTTRSDFEEFLGFYSQVHNPEYIGHVPGTITCSRDAVKPAEFLFFSTPQAQARQAEDTRRMLAHTDYLFARLQNDFPQLEPKRAGLDSNTIYFRKPADWIVSKYFLAVMRLDGQEFAHVVVMPHVDLSVLGDFLTDLKKSLKNAN